MTKFRITAPTPGFTGLSADVNFTNGVAEIDAPGDDLQHPDTRRVAYFKAAGYGVEPVEDQDQVLVDEPTGEREPAPTAPAKSASKADWVAYAVLLGAKEADVEKLNRDELVAQFGAKEGDQK